ncbi:hypothetical protein WA158_002070 [Blastocystis sp. Blastoise]
MLIEELKFYYTPKEVNSLLEQNKCSIHDLLIDLASQIKQYANIPISNFCVGAAALGKTGSIYCGVNIELKYISMGQVIHAEQCTILNAAIHSLENHETGIEILAVTETPCGHCRQFLQELPDCGEIEVFVPSHGIQCPLKNLLPHSFELPIDGRLWKIFEQPTEVFVPSKENQRIWDTFCDDHHLSNGKNIINYAYQLMTHSFAPYSKSKASVVLINSKKKLFFGGMTVESAAYNPTMTASQSSVVSMITRFESMDDIDYMLILECKNPLCDIKSSSLHLSQVLPKQNDDKNENKIKTCYLCQ